MPLHTHIYTPHTKLVTYFPTYTYMYLSSYLSGLGFLDTNGKQFILGLCRLEGKRMLDGKHTECQPWDTNSQMSVLAFRKLILFKFNARAIVPAKNCETPHWLLATGAS